MLTHYAPRTTARTITVGNTHKSIKVLAAATRAAIRVAALGFVLVAQPLLAQSISELEALVFYPTPLEITKPLAAADTSVNKQQQLLALAEDPGSEGFNFQLQASPTDQYLQAIARLDASEGPFAQGLFQNLLSLGLLYQQQNEHERAIEVLERASAISRINNGLYAPEQISLTQHIIDSLIATGQLDEVENKYEFLVNLHKQLYGFSTPQTALALQGLGEWKLQSFQHNLLQPDSGQMLVARDSGSLFVDYQVYSSQFETLDQAQEKFLEAIRVLIENEAFSNPALYELEQDLLATFFINANRELVLNDPRNFALNSEPGSTKIRKKNELAGLPADYRKGQDSYMRLIGYLKINQSATMQQLADALLGLADWHLMFGKYAKAEEQYQKLEALLVKANMDPRAIADIMQPAIPPTLPVFLKTAISADAAADAPAYQGYVDVALNLNRYGRVSSLDLVGSSPGTSEDVEARLVSLVRNAQFRPALGGRSTTGVRYYYTY